MENVPAVNDDFSRVFAHNRFNAGRFWIYVPDLYSLVAGIVLGLSLGVPRGPSTPL